MGANWLESSSAERDLGVLVGTESAVSQPCTPVTNKSPSTLGCIQTTASGLREVILPLCSALLRNIWGPVPISGLPSTRKI